MDTLLQTLLRLLSGDSLKAITDKLGVDEASAQKAIGLALPLIIGSLNRNSSSADGAQALTNALSRDHDGSILGDLASNLGRQDLLDDGMAILGHVLGEKRTSAGKTIGQATGLGSQQTMQLMGMLAPVVLGALGKTQRENKLDAQGVASLLTQEREQANSTLPGIAQLLDMDGDGDVTEEMINLGGSLLSSFLSKKK
ncbi:MAG: DUF937 domain-containing protein [Anaerolineales bacterium]|nr:MAG: DUF937 domain-containing protein [Anaerolineales bacterium]